MEDVCDICGKINENLVDYYAMICPECKIKYQHDIEFLKRMANLKNEEDNLKKEEDEKIK